MKIKLNFYGSDLNSDTGYKYIYDQCRQLPTITTQIILPDGDVKFHIFKLPFLIFLGWAAKFFTMRYPESNSVLVGLPKSINELFFLAKNKKRFYMVDSLYDYYSQRLENNNKITKHVILKMCYRYELVLLDLCGKNLFLNSYSAALKMKKRVSGKKCDNLMDKIQFLPIGINNKNYTNNKERGSKIPINKKFGIWGNFGFYENRIGLTKFLEEFKKQQRLVPGVSIEISGNGLSDDICSEFASSQVKFLGRVNKMETFWKSCDGFILAVEQTNGIKTKLLELMLLGKPFLVKNSVYKHFGPHLELPSNGFSDGEYSLRQFCKFIDGYKSTSYIEHPLIDWKFFIHILQHTKS